MKRALQISILLALLLILYCSSGKYNFREREISLALENYSIASVSEEEMYEKYVQTLLEEKLYNSRDAYDTCHYLMVPMYYAFQTQNQEYIEMFQKHMDRFAALTEKEKEAFREIGLLDRLHYMYFVTEYMCLCAENRVPVSEQLYSFVYSEMEDVTENYTGAWKSTAEYKNMWELLDGLLTGEGYGNGKSYECAVTDFELFSLAVLCDLKVIAEENSMDLEMERDIFSKAVNCADRIFDSQVTWQEDGTWFFQMGVWRDHPDYQFAGIENPDDIVEGQDYRVYDCTWDAGHSMRFPLHLRSYQRASKKPERQKKYNDLLEGYGKTFVKNVLVTPDTSSNYYRMNNYMNGRNGLYRYGYNQDSVGIGPYQNSVYFLLGWYAFSGNDEISEAYCETAQKFPLDVSGKKLYTDPTTIREQNPIFTMENYRQFLCYLAGKLEF